MLQSRAQHAPACRGPRQGGSSAAVTVLALSRHLSFHARGDAAFVWHGLTGDVAEMSRDVLALLLSFDPSRDDALPASPELPRDQAEEFTGVLRARRYLIQPHTDEMAALLPGFPRVPRAAVFERRDRDRVTVYTRSGGAI